MLGALTDLMSAYSPLTKSNSDTTLGRQDSRLLFHFPLGLSQLSRQSLGFQQEECMQGAAGSGRVSLSCSLQGVRSSVSYCLKVLLKRLVNLLAGVFSVLAAQTLAGGKSQLTAALRP